MLNEAEEFKIEVALLGLLGLTVTISLASEINKEISKRQKIANIDGNSKLLTRGFETVGHDEIRDSSRHTNQELGDLHGGQITLTRRMKADRCHGIVHIHDGVDE